MRVARSWAGVFVDPVRAIDDLDTALEMAQSVGEDESALPATGYKCFNLGSRAAVWDLFRRSSG